MLDGLAAISPGGSEWGMVSGNTAGIIIIINIIVVVVVFVVVVIVP